MLRVGLTGGTGCGKSTVSARLAERGAHVVDADLVAREVVEPGTDGLAAVVDAFGRDVLRPDGTLDRPGLGRRVFGDAAALARLNGLLHPRIAARTAELVAAAEAADPDGVLVHDVALLVENGLAGAYDVVVVVDARPATARDRLVATRGLTAREADARIAAQATPEQRRAVADVVLPNDGSREELLARVDALWERLRAAGRSGWQEPAGPGTNGR